MPAMYRRRTLSLRSFRKSGSSTARRAKGNIRASLQMRDQSNVTLQGIVQVPVSVSNLNNGGDEDRPISISGAYASTGNAVGISIWQLAFLSQFYNNYKNMYDQMKLNGFRCKILGNSASTLTMASGLSSVSVVTAFDRNGISGVPFSATVPADNQSVRSPYLNITGTSLAAVNQVLSYGSAKSKPWSPGNSFNQWISGYAQTAQETQQWISTDKLKASKLSTIVEEAARSRIWSLGYPSGLSNPGIFDADSRDPEAMDEGDGAKYSKTAQAISSSPIYWDPVVLLGVYNVPRIQGNVADQVFTFTVEYKIDVSFRGTRSGTITDPTANRVEGTEIVQTLNVAVDPGEVVDIEPASGTVWNHAIIEGNAPDTRTLNLGTLHAGDVIDREPPEGEYYDRVVGEVEAGGAEILGLDAAVGVNLAGELLPDTTRVWPDANANQFIFTPLGVDREVALPVITGNTFPRTVRLKINAAEYLFHVLRATLEPRDEPYRFNDGPYDSAYIEVPPPQYDKLVKRFVGNGKFTGEGLYNGYEIYVNVPTSKVVFNNFDTGAINMYGGKFTFYAQPTSLSIGEFDVLVTVHETNSEYEISMLHNSAGTAFSLTTESNTWVNHYKSHDGYIDNPINVKNGEALVCTFDYYAPAIDVVGNVLHLSKSYFSFDSSYQGPNP